MVTTLLGVQDAIQSSVKDAVLAAQKLESPEALLFIETLSCMIAQCYKDGQKIIIAGNGGSLCDAMHFAEELTGFFRGKRKALPAIALSDPGHMSCVSNDIGYDEIFARGVEAYGVEGDIFIALTTSGNSPNLTRAVDVAQKRGLKTVAFLGKTGGKLKGVCDLEWIVDGFTYSDRVQEAHMVAIHITIETVERLLFEETSK
ncbi:MAG: SIS domain-containing protein [Chlamydiia bacterium]|nr:SIS domain-containing protein [Chlamydiia bacterium]HPE85160.1 SIS domain-containing protein [Chlamydiales bacterium]